MNVAIITSRYPSVNNPYNHMFVHMRAIEFVKQKHQVKIFVPSEINVSSVHEGIPVIRDSAKEIIKRLLTFDICYLHLVNIYPFKESNGWIIYKYLLENSAPFAVYVHGNEVQKYTSRLYEYNFSIIETLKWVKKDFFVIPKMKHFVNKAIIRPNTLFIFPSQWMKHEAERNLKVKFNNFKIIPNGIDIKLFQFSQQKKNRFKLITIRSLSQKVYNIEFTIRILKELPKKYTLDIYGEGIYAKRYQKLINQLDLDNRVQIIKGFFERNELKYLFEKYGGYLSTTRMDSQGITMLEAMASGLVVVSTDNSSKKEFIDDLSTGILGKTPKETAEKIVSVFSDTDKYESMARKGADSIKNLNNSNTVKEEIRALNGLIL